MYVVLGATGHIGSAAAAELIRGGANVVAVTRSVEKGQRWRDAGANVAVLDIADAVSLFELFRKARRALLINPPARVSGDTDVAEMKTVDQILSAVEGSGLERVVAESTYGAQRCDRCGDLGILYEFENRLRAQTIPASIIRGAYYFSNWDMSLATARREGVIYSMFPAEFVLPMVAPEDIGIFAASILSGAQYQPGTHYVEGPARYCADDVAEAFSVVLGKAVRVVVIPPDRWEEAFLSRGFSKKAAVSYARMIRITLNKLELPDRPVRGPKSLRAYIDELVRRSCPVD